jgi:DNA helicase IV
VAASSSQSEDEPTERSGLDPILTAERDQLRRSREYLHMMREDVLSLKALGGDPVSEEYLKADLYHRAEALKDIPDTPLFFGRLDYAGPPEGWGAGDDGVDGVDFHIGRRHVHAPDGTPAVIDWRAPVSRPFYRASSADPMNLALRRRFGFSGGELTAYEDELFTTDRSGSEGKHRTSQILLDEIERPRSGPMRDIVATIQPDQDDIVRAGAAQTVCVQGAPGTGKTAVGLHRVAYLLYAYSEQVRRRGVVMVGPNRAFLSYIRNVLPALGELDVTQTTVGELVAAAGTVAVRGDDNEAAAIVKGDARMAAVLRRGPRTARAQDRARDPDPDGGRRGGLRRPDARGGAAVQAGARGRGRDLAEGRSGPAGVRAAGLGAGAGGGGRGNPHCRRTGRDRVAVRTARSGLGALVRGRRRAHRRGARPDHADAQPGPRGCR